MKINNLKLFERLVSEANQQAFSGWDFSYLNGRWYENYPSWDYKQIVYNKSRSISSLLDTGTGGGEFLSTLTPFPPLTWATESYFPNVSVAQKKLEPLGCKVAYVESIKSLPFNEQKFDLIINRHESFSAQEFFRILKTGGSFITQQVGGRNNIQLNELLSGKYNSTLNWNLDSAIDELLQAGFKINSQEEEFPELVFDDIGAIIYYLKAIPWQVEDFSIDKYYEQLSSLHNLIQDQGNLSIKSHYFFIEAYK